MGVAARSTGRTSPCGGMVGENRDPSRGTSPLPLSQVLGEPPLVGFEPCPEGLLEILFAAVGERSPRAAVTERRRIALVAPNATFEVGEHQTFLHVHLGRR
jgi:hypothetical protein